MNHPSVAKATELSDLHPVPAASPVANEPADDAIDADAYRGGDSECFREIVKLFGPQIRSIASSYTDDSDDQDELYQHVCLRLLTQRSRYREQGAFRGWVIKLAHTSCLNWCTAEGARTRAIDRYSEQTIPVEAATVRSNLRHAREKLRKLLKDARDELS